MSRLRDSRASLMLPQIQRHTLDSVTVLVLLDKDRSCMFAYDLRIASFRDIATPSHRATVSSAPCQYIYQRLLYR